MRKALETMAKAEKARVLMTLLLDVLELDMKAKPNEIFQSLVNLDRAEREAAALLAKGMHNEAFEHGIRKLSEEEKAEPGDPGEAKVIPLNSNGL